MIETSNDDVPQAQAPSAAADAQVVADAKAEGHRFPDGHFYSPIVDTKEVSQRLEILWPSRPAVSGIDFNDSSHVDILKNIFPKYLGEFDFAERASAEDEDLEQFYIQNSQFSWLDARALFVLMREWKPAQIVEVGSGYSTMLMANVNHRFLDGSCAITCIEPYPRPFLRKGLPGFGALLEQKVQDVSLDIFAALGKGDILFIDSSHVAKTGSDVNHLFFEILPRLAPGVRVHVHDIFLPHEYPKEWVIDENRSWNEQYVLRALLMYSTAFRALFGCNYAFSRFPDLVSQVLALPGGRAFGGGSFWMERS